MMVDKIKQKRGKKSRAQGGAFEKRVRADLESKGFICDKWTNNVEFPKKEGCGKEVWRDEDKFFICGEDNLKLGPEFCKECKNNNEGKLIQAKPKFLFINGGMRMVGNSSGFPDFISFKPGEVGPIVGVESKMTGDLDRPEKEKCKWLLDNGIFDKILIASKHKIKNRIHIEYEDFTKKYYRFLK